MSYLAPISSLLYFVCSIAVALSEARGHAWAGVGHLGTFLVTLPASFPLAAAGVQPDLYNLANVAVLIFASTALFYLVTSFAARWATRQ